MHGSLIIARNSYCMVHLLHNSIIAFAWFNYLWK